MLIDQNNLKENWCFLTEERFMPKKKIIYLNLAHVWDCILIQPTVFILINAFSLLNATLTFYGITVAKDHPKCL